MVPVVEWFDVGIVTDEVANLFVRVGVGDITGNVGPVTAPVRNFVLETIRERGRDPVVGLTEV